jgi:hypothetical protein
VAVLWRAAGILAPGGHIGILEWSCPASPLGSLAWRATVRAIEPPVAYDILDGGLDWALAEASLAIASDRQLAGGRARIVNTHAA